MFNFPGRLDDNQGPRRLFMVICSSCLTLEDEVKIKSKGKRVVGGALPHSESLPECPECPYGQTTKFMSPQIFLVAEQHVSSKKRYDFPEQWKPEIVMWITG
ncbi:hypothetical protein M405DRAFT_841911 [Rhizopogon salebrosus TDB-379]|nr:hypothetical protein M405DRAFT_841911 [Rhizopogon salebrosus TDB-379]